MATNMVEETLMNEERISDWGSVLSVHITRIDADYSTWYSSSNISFKVVQRHHTLCRFSNGVGLVSFGRWVVGDAAIGRQGGFEILHALFIDTVSGIEEERVRHQFIIEDQYWVREKDPCPRTCHEHTHFLGSIKTSESQFSVIPAEELEEVLTSYNSAPSVNTNNHNHTSKSTANGSIITMTMKNNHLIVETEERILNTKKVFKNSSKDFFGNLY
ncbi:hypothetical protein J6590_076622 [Homalodisca vitripennis]|nr:hypothetical protein J6590_076622 [Homalodisca vitripennis]